MEDDVCETEDTCVKRRTTCVRWRTPLGARLPWTHRATYIGAIPVRILTTVFFRGTAVSLVKPIQHRRVSRVFGEGFDSRRYEKRRPL